MYKKRRGIAIIFALPFIAFVGLFLFYPAVINIINSFFKFSNRLDNNPVYIGFDNYLRVFKDNNFWRSLINTGILILCVVVFQIGTALILALLVNNLSRGSTVFRVIFFMPIVVSATAIGLLYLMLIQPNGLFSAIFGKKDFNWLPGDSPLALIVVMIPILWQYTGFYFVIFLTGLSQIPEDINEAAKIDGANALRTTFSITLPMLQNVFRTCIVLAVTGALKVFDMPHVIAKDGAPGLKTIFMGTFNNYLYSSNRLGESAVYSLLIVFVGVLVSVMSNKIFSENKDI